MITIVLNSIINYFIINYLTISKVMEEGNKIFHNSIKPKFLHGIRNKMRTTGYSPKTIEAYTKWIKEFIIFNKKKHPEELGKNDVEDFLTYLAVKRNVSASTQNQALSAILYLYKKLGGNTRFLPTNL